MSATQTAERPELALSFAREPRSVLRATRAVVSFARRLGISDAQRERVHRAVSRALRSAVECSSSNAEIDTLDVSVSLLDDQLAVVIEDHGWVIHASAESGLSGGSAMLPCCDFLAVTPAGCGGVRVEMRFFENLNVQDEQRIP